jgi:hypothetical protein
MPQGIGGPSAGHHTVSDHETTDDTRFVLTVQRGDVDLTASTVTVPRIYTQLKTRCTESHLTLEGILLRNQCIAGAETSAIWS